MLEDNNTRWIIIFVSFVVGFYSTKIRFENPSLTETELLLKILGIN